METTANGEVIFKNYSYGCYFLVGLHYGKVSFETVLMVYKNAYRLETAS